MTKELFTLEERKQIREDYKGFLERAKEINDQEILAILKKAIENNEKEIARLEAKAKAKKSNSRETMFKVAVKEVLNEILGGLENAMMDNEKGSEEYNNARHDYYSKDLIVEEVYDRLNNGEVIWTSWGNGFVVQKDIRFLTKARCIEIIENRYEKLIDRTY